MCPEVSAASGGVAVIYACVETLRQAGHDAVVLHARADYRYPGTPFRPPILASADIGRTYLRQTSRRRKLHVLKGLLKSRAASAGSAYVDLRPDDVIVVPEFMIVTATETFPDHRKVVFSQNSFSYIRLFDRAIRAGADPDATVLCNVGINDTCMEAFSLMSDRPGLRIVVSPDLDLFDDGQAKQRTITYMPRKRKSEADFLHAALERRGKVADFDLIRLDRMTQPEVARHMAESLIFVSLMKDEALGFPGIEAMASGCIVVGFTGLGTEEYFTPETGFPIREGDNVGLVLTVERIAAEYRADPARLDALRRHASGVVRARYNPQAFRDTLLEAWDRIDRMARRDGTGLELAAKSVN